MYLSFHTLCNTSLASLLVSVYFYFNENFFFPYNFTLFFFKDFRADNVLRLYFELVLDFIRFVFTLHIISFINKFLFIH